jgi:DNA polymerase I
MVGVVTLKKTENRTLLIDGDIFFYKFAFSNEGSIMFDEPETEEEADTPAAHWVVMERARLGVDDFVVKLREDTGCKDVLMVYSFSTASNFRYKVLPSYKGNRSGKEKPELHSAIKEYIMENYPSKTLEGIEADDILGIMQTRNPDDYVIASIDKDMRQIPGYLYNWNKGGLKKITEVQADSWFYTQVLIGDACDGYTGCKGIGPKKAMDFLEGCQTEQEYWSAVVRCYESKRQTEEQALQQARVARILRNTDYNFKKKEVILWTPKNTTA